MKRILIIPLISLLVFANACEDEGRRFSLLAYDQSIDQYGFQTVEISTLDDVGSLKGDVTELRAHADLTLDFVGNETNLRFNDRSVLFQATEQGGVLVPDDFHSLAMATIYYNLEISHDFFVNIGMPEDLLGLIPTYYDAHMEVITSEYTSLATDNAVYMRYLIGVESNRAFLVFPFVDLQWIPMAINSGVITHEYTHAVYDELIGTKVGLLEESWSRREDYYSQNNMDSLNEGLADFMAVARAGDPDFIEHSLPPGTDPQRCNTLQPVEVTRMAQIPLEYTDGMEFAALSIPPAGYCAYQVGEYVSALFYSFASILDQPLTGAIPSQETRYAVATDVYQSMIELGEYLGDHNNATSTLEFGLWTFFDLFVGRYVIEASDGTNTLCSAGGEFCNLLNRDYQMHYTSQEVPNCFIPLNSDC